MHSKIMPTATVKRTNKYSPDVATHMRYMMGGLEADRKITWAYLKANGGSAGTSSSMAKTPVVVDTASKRTKKGDWIVSIRDHPNTTS